MDTENIPPISTASDPLSAKMNATFEMSYNIASKVFDGSFT